MNRPAPWQALTEGLLERRPFRVGGAMVDPVSRDAKWPGGEERLQPQTLKVLISLFSRKGEVVTRDELVQLCWDGRIVGTDVINRSISLLRHFAERAGGFEIETVPKSGYRLMEGKPGSGGKFELKRRQIAVTATFISLVIIGAAGVYESRLSRAKPDSVMLQPFDVAGKDAMARTFAAGVSGDVNSALSAAGVDVVDANSSGRVAPAGFVLSGRAERPGSDLHLTAQLQDSNDHTVLWSTSFTRPATQMQAMQEQVSANLAAVLRCALDTSRQPGGDLDRDTIELYLKACALEQSVQPPSDQLQDLLRQVTAREPRFAEGWARLALWAANAAFGASPQDAQKYQREARVAVQEALHLDPKSGTAYNAIAELELGHVPFALLHRQFQKVLSFAPDDAFTINDECELLLRMGRLDDSMRMCRRGVELEPLSPEQVSDLVIALIGQSRDAEAQATLARALRMWPDDNRLKSVHLDYEARVGDPGAALAILNDPDARPQLSDPYLEAYRRLAQARKADDRGQTQAFIVWLKEKVASGQIDAQFATPTLAGLGDVNDAFRIAFAAPSDVLQQAPDPMFLWEPDSASLRRDPRFIALAAKFHVADFWPETGLWPDFCSTKGWPYNCKAEAARFAQRARA